MSKHVWLVKPTQGKADRLLEIWRSVGYLGWTTRQRRRFATYALESETQKGVGGYRYTNRGMQHGDLVQGAINSNHRYAQGHNAGNYERCFLNHLPLMLAEDYQAAGLDPSAPPPILADKLEEAGSVARAQEIRLMVEGVDYE